MNYLQKLMAPALWWATAVTTAVASPLAAAGKNMAPAAIPAMGQMVRIGFDSKVGDRQITVVRARVGSTTHIEFAEGEGMTVTEPMVGNSVEWSVEGAIRHLFVKPDKIGTTTLSVVTNFGGHEFALIGVGPNEPYHQKVTFVDTRKRKMVLMSGDATPETGEAGKKDAPQEPGACDLSHLEFGAEVSGTAAFRPSLVGTSTRVTCVRLPGGVVPAVFALEGEEPTLVNNAMMGNILVVERPRANLLLKLGDDEVVVRWPVTGANQ